jgi:hypothetical protein
MKGNVLMRFIYILTVVAVVFALSLAGAPAPAQDATPQGSYQQTCTDISVKKDTLYANCQDANGKPHSTRLSSYEKCGADIENKKGNLACAHTEHAAPTVPTGSYTETCKNAQMKGSTLHAVCRSADGHEAPASLRNADRCSDGVINLNGILSCDVSDVLPPGSYISTCRDVRMKGATLYAACDDGKDHWVNAELHEAHKCTGDIVNQNGALRCTPIRTMERR